MDQSTRVSFQGDGVRFYFEPTLPRDRFCGVVTMALRSRALEVRLYGLENLRSKISLNRSPFWFCDLFSLFKKRERIKKLYY